MTRLTNETVEDIHKIVSRYGLAHNIDKNEVLALAQEVRERRAAEAAVFVEQIRISGEVVDEVLAEERELQRRRAADLKPEEVEALEVLLRWFDDLENGDAEESAEAGADVIRKLLAAHGAAS